MVTLTRLVEVGDKPIMSGTIPYTDPGLGKREKASWAESFITPCFLSADAL